MFRAGRRAGATEARRGVDTHVKHAVITVIFPWEMEALSKRKLQVLYILAFKFETLLLQFEQLNQTINTYINVIQLIGKK